MSFRPMRVTKMAAEWSYQHKKECAIWPCREGGWQFLLLWDRFSLYLEKIQNTTAQSTRWKVRPKICAIQPLWPYSGGPNKYLHGTTHPCKNQLLSFRVIGYPSHTPNTVGLTLFRMIFLYLKTRCPGAQVSIDWCKPQKHIPNLSTGIQDLNGHILGSFWSSVGWLPVPFDG